MNIKEIQKLVEEFGAAVIVGEEGPKIIAISYETYRGLVDSKGNGLSHERSGEFVPAITEEDRLTFPEQIANRAEKLTAAEQELIEKLNQDIAVLKEEIKKKELGEIGID